MSIKHCIKVDDFSRNEILDLFQLASELKSKYRNKPKSKDLKDMFDTYISGDKDMEKKYRKIR